MVEVIKTYYSKDNSSSQKEFHLFPEKNFFKQHKNIIIICVLVLFLILCIVLSDNINKNKEITIAQELTPSTQMNNIIYYDYSQLICRQFVDNTMVVELNPKIRCAALELGKATDLSKAVISFKAKTEDTAERLAFILKDNQNISNGNQNDLILTPMLHNNEWQLFSINLANIYLPLDTKNVTQIRFTAADNFAVSNGEGKIYIKNISIEKRSKL